MELAADSASRNRGLLGRDGLSPDHALILAPSNFVHTFFMKFPIDILFVARDGRVLKVRRAVPAWRISGRPGAFCVIELAAGTADRCGVVAGDHVSVVSA